MNNRIEKKDYWGERDIILAFSRQDKGLIAIGEKCKDGGEKFIHVKIEDIMELLELKKRR